MGGCDSKPRKLNRKIWNPIQQFLKHTTLQEIQKNWDPIEAMDMKKQLQKNPDERLSYQKFLFVFPGLHDLSDKTKKKLFQMLDFQERGTAKRKDIITFKIVAVNINSPDLISQIIYYTYSQEELIDPQKLEYKSVMKFQGLQRFREENRERLNDFQFQGRKQKQVGMEKQREKTYTLEDFQTIFEEYEYKKFYMLFTTALQSKTEDELKDIIKNQKDAFSMTTGSAVYLVEYSWFENWCAYMKKNYKVTVDYKSLEKNPSYIRVVDPEMAYYSTPTSKYPMKKSVIQSFVEQNELGSRPKRINNNLLLGSQLNQLRENLQEGVHYVMVKKKIWDLFMKTYGGSPVIKRKYPQIYAFTIFVASIDQLGYFKPKQLAQYIVSRTQEVNSFVSDKMKISNTSALYYKYIGLENWCRMKNRKVSFGEGLPCSVIYFVAVPLRVIENFQKHYNVQFTVERGRRIENRIKNYASLINIKVDGALIKGAVTQIFTQAIEVTFKTGDNLLMKKRMKEHKLKQINSSDLSKDKRLNYLAGMNNFQNNCYMNSTVQCLIKTPHFKLTLQNYITQELQNNEQSVIMGLLDIYRNSSTQDLIDMQKFKKIMQVHLQIYQGNSHQDAQQFLLALFEQIQRQSKFKEKEEQKIGLKRNLSTNSLAKLQSRILKPFTGCGFANTQCKQCHNIKETTSQFHTYSLNLPDCAEYQIGYYIVPKVSLNKPWVIQLCKMTLDEDDTVDIFRDKVAETHKIHLDDYFFYSFSNGQLFTEISSQPHKKMKHFQNYGMQLILYQVDRETRGYYVQVQMRSEMYDKKSFKMYEIPILLEISPGMTWKQIQEKLIRIFFNRYNSDLNTMLSDMETVSRASQSSKETKASSKNLPFIIQYLKKSRQEGKSPINIRFMEKSSGKCHICKKQIPFSKHINIGFNFCKGCLPPDEYELGSDRKFKKQSEDYVIMLDWDCPERFLGLELETNFTVEIARKNFENRKIKLTQVIQDNFEKEQEIELRCERDDCQCQMAIRKQGISTYPDILLIHLNRFRYRQSGLVKINNYIQYDSTLVINGQQYQLYGTVIHDGNCNKGHYYNYVRHQSMWFYCNDDRVTKVEQDQQYDPNVYLLFYKKKLSEFPTFS